MVIATRDYRRPRRGTKRGGVELRVAQPRLCDAVHGRRRNNAPKGTRHPVTLVVSHDEQDVGRAFGWYNARRPVWFRIDRAFLDHATKFQLRRWKLFSADGGSGAGGSWFASGLYLCYYGRRSRHNGGSEHPAKEDVFC